MSRPVTIVRQVHFRHGRGRRKLLAEGARPEPAALPPGRVPRLARLMALAIRPDDLLQRGEVDDYAEVARLGHVTRARVTQIMNLLCLAPDIQEAILFLPLTQHGRDPVREHMLRPVASVLDWRKQRKMWAAADAHQAHRRGDGSDAGAGTAASSGCGSAGTAASG
ncbi:MAG: hypothetical protein BWZ02_00093 [Lentisphaerae bacterium ADurb.BinA184]|nr:MAG: hypothetical protein BWZ02_00093 [Lentisphaerae bacterium ADurb.BinA184]